MTALALFGFSISHLFRMLCFWAIPYGLGAGSVDAALNNYVALHYASRHMSWIHCMWGVGASLGLYIMGYALSGGQRWNMGYRYIAILQVGLTFILLCSLPLWKGQAAEENENVTDKALSLRQIVKVSGAREVMITNYINVSLLPLYLLVILVLMVIMHEKLLKKAGRLSDETAHNLKSD